MPDYLTPQDSAVIQDALVTFLEANLIDPYEQRTSKTRSNFVRDSDFKNVSTLASPHLQVDLADYNPVKINTQTKTNFLEEETHTFAIYYYNAKDKRFTFADNGLTLINESQAMKYLQYVKDTLKANLDDPTFANFHWVTFGSISKPRYNPKTQLYVSFLPMTVKTYRR